VNLSTTPLTLLEYSARIPDGSKQGFSLTRVSFFSDST
jgi:hypothetical protein